MQYQSPYRKPKKKKGRALLVFVIVVVVLAAVAAGIVLAGRLGGGTAGRRAAGGAFRAEGPVAALRLDAPTGEMTAEALGLYFEEAVAAARAQGLNTLIFEGRQGLSVLWEDGTFPLVAEAEAAGTDPLALLCEAAKGQEVQVFVSLDPWAGGKYTSEAKGAAVDYARAKNDPVRFEMDDADYQKLLLESFSDLTMFYPVAGIALGGLEEEMAGDTGFATSLTEMQAAIGETTLALDTAALGEAGAREWATLVKAGEADLLIAALAEGGQLGTRLDAYSPAEGGLVLDESAQDASGAALFTASRQAVFGGAVYGSWPGADPGRTGFLRSTLAEAEGELPEGFDIPRTLQVNYPLESDTIAADQTLVYVMGNSDPDAPLLLDGTEVARPSTDGSFGVAYTLQDGENTLTFTQGDNTVTHTIHRPNPPVTGGGDGGGDGGGEPAVQNDNTTEAEPGQAVQIKGVFAGGLTDPNDDGAINETYYGGAVGVVRDSFETWRYDTDAGKTLKTWAYQLTSGDWVLARNCALIDGDGASAFTGLSAAAHERGEWITLEGTGTPAAIISCEENILSLTLHDTSFTLAEGFSSSYVKSASVEPIENGVRLDLRVEGIWGYQIDYTEGTRLFLKAAPTLSDDPAGPFTGIHIMLDPGHGDTDMGAPGIMGAKQGPNEKDVNLAQAQAIAYRLRQLGAQVTMIREGETFYTVSERLAMQIEEKPDFFLSVHHNSANLNIDLTNATGLQVYYHIPKGYTAPLSQQYAQNLMDGIAAATGRKAADAAYGYFTVTRTPVCPSVLFEYGFMVNPADFSDATSAEGLYAAACGTAEGIYNTLAGNTPADSADTSSGGGSSLPGGESQAE